MESKFSRSVPQASGAIVVLSVAVFMAGCSKRQDTMPAQQAAEVVVFTVASAALPMFAELPGRTNAYQIADVRPQVGGIIQKRQFVEGTDVQAGALLYQIDPSIFVAQHNLARASLTKAKANLLTSGPKAARYKELVAIDGVSRQEYDDAVASYEQAKADVESATAALESATINLKYTSVTAPISGRVSRSTVTAGALVTASQQAALTTVQQLDPIYVDVTQSSTDLLHLQRQLASGSLKKTGDGQAKVNLLLPDGSTYSEPGKLQFSGVSVEPTTGNVVLRALFPNPKGQLLPGMYVRAQLETGVNEKAITVPQVGVSRNQKGEATSMILNKENKVEQRILKTNGTNGTNWLVTSGLVAGDRVIVEGLQKIKPGAPAVAVPAIAAAAASPQ